MLKGNTQQLMDEFVTNTNSKGALITNIEGQRLHTNATELDNSSLDKIAAMMAVSDSLYNKLNDDINGDNMELTLIVSKSEYVVLKQVVDDIILLTHYDRSKDVNQLYTEVNTFVESIIA